MAIEQDEIVRINNESMHFCVTDYVRLTSFNHFIAPLIRKSGPHLPLDTRAVHEPPLWQCEMKCTKPSFVPNTKERFSSIKSQCVWGGGFFLSIAVNLQRQRKC